MTPLAWGRRVAPAFRARVIAIADGLGCDPSDLMACMAWESGCTFSSSKCNEAGSGAVGLIQFMPQTAGQLHTTTAKDSSLTGLEKMEQVVTNAIPTAVALFATGGVTTTADQVEDAVRGAAQLIYNQTMSTTVPALATDAEKIVTAILAPPVATVAAAA